MPRKQKQDKLEEQGDKKEDWDIVGWINDTKGSVYTISDAEGNTTGMIMKTTVDRFLEGEINGVPIKAPKDGFKPREDRA